MKLSVIVVTLNRPDYMKRCLDCLVTQDPVPDQIIVVDASKDDLTANVVKEFPDVIYLRNENGYGRMTASRNIGLRKATGEIIAFLDDDSFAHPGWAKNLLAAYEEADDTVGIIGGRALNGKPGEENIGVPDIGKMLNSGVLLGFFAADPGKIIEVQHVLGANMSYRRSTIAKLGGFREDYPGISGICEDSDMCLRVRRAGYKILFTPFAVVDHVAAPQAKGRRFDPKYFFFHRRNNYTMVIRNFGIGATAVRHGIATTKNSVIEFVRKTAGCIARFITSLAGSVAGIYCGVMALATKGGTDPIRHDAEAQELRAWLETRGE